MLDVNKFKKIMIFTSENFSFEICETTIKMTHLYLERGGINDVLFEKGMLKLCETLTQEEWNKKYGYGGSPALADWLKMFSKLKEDEGNRKIGAWCTARKIMLFAKTELSQLSDNEHNERARNILNQYGGIDKLRTDIKSNDVQRLTRDLANMAYKSFKKGSNTLALEAL